MNNVFLILFVCICILLTFNNLEAFNVFASNASNVPQTNTSQDTYQMDTEQFKSIIATFDKQLPDFKTTFQKHPNLLTFVFEKQFKEFLYAFFENALKNSSYFKDSVMQPIRELTNLWINDTPDGARHFVFNIDIALESKPFTRKLYVYLLVPNVQRYLTDTGDISPLTDNIDIQLQHLSLVFADETLVVPFSNLFNYYQIYNTLYLTDPYLTSGKDMQITESQRTQFNNKLQDNVSNVQVGTCFPENIKASNENDCLTSGGSWDTKLTNDRDCPFFMANSNYPNTFGKIIDAHCVLPLNMKRIGNRYFSREPEFGPFCYNCKDKLINTGTLGLCCSEQLDKLKYPGLTSPDFAFAGDTDLRKKYSQLLSDKNLSIE